MSRAVAPRQGGQLALKYEPRSHFMPLHERQTRWACLVVHRRGGKTVACINELLTRASYTPKKNARYAYIAPFYRQAKDVAWQYIKDFGEELIDKIRESELRVELFNGAWITLYGADNPDALRGLYLDGVVLDEYGDCRPSLWGTVVLPTLADRKGWAVFIGTIKGRNHFYTLSERAKESKKWYQLTLPASQSGILDEEELEEMKAEMTDDAYRQEMECDASAAVLGTYYAAQIAEMENMGRIALNEAQFNAQRKVFVAADLGLSDSTAFWFWQESPDGFQIIDYFEDQGKKLPHYFDMLDAKGYDYDTLWLPHDARADTLATVRSTIEQTRDHFAEAHPDAHVAITPKLRIQHGIDAARLILPQCYFNSHKCKAGIEALRAYSRRYDEVAKAFAEVPRHDWSSDGADAFRYLALVCKPTEKPKLMRPTGPSRPKSPEYKLEELFKDREANTGDRRYQKLRMG